jgi:hypothetical protein
MRRLLLALCCLPLVMPFAASAEIYKWKDKSGRIQYSDSPPLSNTPYTTLSGKKSAQPAMSAPEPAPAPAEGQPMPAPGSKAGKTPANMPPGGPQAPADPEATKEKVPQELKDKAAQEAAGKQQEEAQKAAAAKEQACTAARARAAQFEQGGRIYRINEKGEREYYGDKEIAAELEKAREDVAANCS